MIVFAYILAVLIPPVPAFIYGGVKHGLLNIVLLVLLWIPAVIHSIIVIGNRDKSAE